MLPLCPCSPLYTITLQSGSEGLGCGPTPTTPRGRPCNQCGLGPHLKNEEATYLIHGVALRTDWNHEEDVKIVTYNKKYRINKNLFQGMSENQLCSMRKVLPKTTSKLQKYIYMYICVSHVHVCTCMYLRISKTRFSYQLIRQDHVKSTVLTFHCNICFGNCFLDTMFYDLSSYIPLR